MKTRFRLDELDDFVDQVDQTGGVPSLHLYEDIDISDFSMRKDLDPFSEEYVQQQLQLYTLMANREVDQELYEQHSFDLEHHAAANNPYGLTDVSHMAKHTATLSNALTLAELPHSPCILDMGCGWGLSSELLYFLGAKKVTAVDINSQFLRLINKRSLRLGYNIHTICSSFDDFRSEESYDLILFYECFHHAIRPWLLLEAMKRLIVHKGKIVLAGEPIQSIFWKEWGMRLDALSVYCVRKFGWFESGFSEGFIRQMCQRSNLDVTFQKGSALGGEPICIIRRKLENANGLLGIVPLSGWALEPEAWVSLGLSEIELPSRFHGEALELEIQNCRGRSIALKLTFGNDTVEIHLEAGTNFVDCRGAQIISLEGETWQPMAELGTIDDRTISFHLKSVELKGQV